MSAPGLAAVAGLAAGLAVACLARARRAGAPIGRPGDQVPRQLGGSGRLAVRWAAALDRAGVEGDPHRWARLARAALVAAALLGALWGGPAAAVLLVVLGAGAVAMGLRAGAGRGERRADAALAPLLEHAARALRAGSDLVPALRTAASSVGGVHGREVEGVVARVEGGAPLAAALDGWERAHRRRAVTLVVAALSLAEATGGARARALDGVAATLRSRRAVADEVRALSGQARASAAVLVALPLVFALLGAAVDPRLAAALVGTPEGLACLAGAAVLDLVGAWWMHRLVQGAGP